MKSLRIIIAVATLATAAALWTACEPKSAAPPAGGAAAYYTCPMHPSVKLADPKARCPICGMSLRPVYGASTNAPVDHQHGETNAAAADENPLPFTVPVARQQMIGVTYVPARRKPLRRTLHALGTVAYDKQKHWDFVARVEGYVQKLHVFSRGEPVGEKQPLMTIYSPDLLVTQNELLESYRLRDAAKTDPDAAASAERMIASTRQRLRLWNISDEQLATLEKTRTATETLVLQSPVRGVVQELGVDQGRKIMPGDHLVDIADLSTVWIWAEFYENEMSHLHTGQEVTVIASAYPDDRLSGKIALMDPFFDEAKRTGRVRIDLSNPGLRLRPETYADVQVALDDGDGLTIPVSAVLPTGRQNVAFVGLGEGRLEPRYLRLGPKYGDDYQVLGGVKEGERVVSSANFLIDAEATLQGALKSW
jgi:Cu(I)/Ag(I) efflux system membrane fusion protein